MEIALFDESDFFPLVFEFLSCWAVHFAMRARHKISGRMVLDLYVWLVISLDCLGMKMEERERQRGDMEEKEGVGK